ncbi:MAG: AAA family ATPase, partial [Cyanobacteria bacterium J06627_8]
MFIKGVELSHFKSFGGTTAVPLKNGFTVISGPNGSGKSNILDALLFALGLSSSKGMRADRLPDLVNQNYSSRSRSTLEASVTVTFDVSDLPQRLITGDDDDDSLINKEDEPLNELDEALSSESNGHDPESNLSHSHLEGDRPQDANGSASQLLEWTVTRKLRVTPQGTYTSTYFINGESCTLTQLHEQLQRFRVYPEGYNVVLQGDVTGIISMNPRERREIIDELAGVAAFDRKIIQAKDKLEAVREREERFRIVEKELTDQRDRLAKDRVKAEKYQRLRQQFQDKSQWELVLAWKNQQRLVQRIEHQIESADQRAVDIAQQIEKTTGQIQSAQEELDRLNARVKALGEDEQLALQSALANQEAELRQLQRQDHELKQAYRDATEQYERLSTERTSQQQQLDELATEKTSQTNRLAQCEQERDRARQELEQRRQDASAIAAASDAWIQEQTALRHQIDTLLQSIEPQRTEHARLQERANQLDHKIQTQASSLESISQDLSQQEADRHTADTTCQQQIEQVQAIAQTLASVEQDLKIQQETQSRLLQEQRQKQRELDKIEAQSQAMQ